MLPISVNPNLGGLTFDDATGILAAIATLAGFRYGPITSGWSFPPPVAPFRGGVYDHQRTTGSYLLLLAVELDGVLVALTLKYHS